MKEQDPTYKGSLAELQALGTAAQEYIGIKIDRHTGSFGMRLLSIPLLNHPKIPEDISLRMVSLLPWLLSQYKEGGKFYMADKFHIVAAAIKQPLAHEALEPFLKDILKCHGKTEIPDGKTAPNQTAKDFLRAQYASSFLEITRAIENSDNDRFKKMAKTASSNVTAHVSQPIKILKNAI